MRVKIHKFRSFEDASFFFNEKEVNLLSGDSGKGKTTILEAVRWCLFSGSGRSVYPFGSNPKHTDPTSVQISFEEGEIESIFRSVPPDTLKLKLKNKKVYTSSDAQKLIYSVFGKEELFGCTSYIPQGERNLLLSSNNVSKVGIFEKLIFDEDDSPDIYISKIDTLLRSSKKDFERSVSKIKEINILLSSKREGVDITEEEFDFVSREGISLEDELIQLRKEIKKEEILLQEKKKNSIQRKELEDKISNLFFEEEGENHLHVLKERKERLEKDFLQSLKIEERNEYISKQLSSISLEVITPTTTSLLRTGNFPFPEWKEYISLYTSNVSREKPEKELDELIKEKKKLNLIKKLLPIHFSERMLSFDFDKISEFKYYFSNITPEIKKRVSSSNDRDKEETLLSRKRELQLEISRTREKNSLLHSAKEKGILSSEDEIPKLRVFVEVYPQKEKYLSLILDREQISRRKEEISSQKVKILEKYIPLQREYSLPSLENFSEDGLTTHNVMECPNCKSKLRLNKNSLEEVKEIYIPDTILKKIKGVVASFKELDLEEKNIEDRFNLLEKEILSFSQEIIDFDITRINFKECDSFLRKIEMFPPSNSDLNSLEEELTLLNIKIEECKLREYYSLFHSFEEDFEKIIFLSSSKTKFENEKKKFKEFLNLSTERVVPSVEDVNRDTDNIEALISQWEEYLDSQQKKKRIDELVSIYPFDTLPSLKVEEINTYERYILLLSELRDVPISSEKIKEEILSISKKIENKLIEIEKKELQLSLSAIPFVSEEEVSTLSSSILKKEEEERKILLLLPIKKKVDDFILLSNEKDEEEFLLSSLEKKITTLEELKKMIISLRGEILFNFIKSIQSITNKILRSVFEDEMIFTINLTKTSSQKSEGKYLERAVINFEVKYKNLTFDSVSVLSGGEKDRLSLALSIAMAICVNSKFLILDESLSSLDEGMRDICVQELKKYTEGRTIINVCHSVTEGYHDNVVEI